MTQPMTDERLAEIRTALAGDEHAEMQLSTQAFRYLSLTDMRGMLARLDAAEELIREVANSGVSFDDERLKCVELQVGRDTFAKCRSYLR